MATLRIQLVLSGALLLSAAASEVVLHDSSLPGIASLIDSGFLPLVNPPIGHQVVLTTDSTGDELDTSLAKGDSAGFFTHSPVNGVAGVVVVPVLDRRSGFSLGLSMQLLSEDHHPSDRNGDGVDDRAGFSVLLVTSDLKAIELGFWADRIWAQEDGVGSADLLFTQAEGVAQSATDMTRMRRYQLSVFGDRYVLVADGVPVLGGLLRDYTAWPGLAIPPIGVLDPYDKPNLIFFGDDTSSASARFKIGSPVTVTSGAIRAFEVTATTSGGGPHELALRWGSLPGLSYTIEMSGNLGDWSVLSAEVSSTGVSEALVPIPEVPRSFYRLEAEIGE